MITAHEGYGESEFYEDFQDQIFEAEEQQLLNDQGKYPWSYCAQIKDILLHYNACFNMNPIICFSLVIVISCPCNRVGSGAIVSGSFTILIKVEE
jgi:hypothetical protein